MNTNNKTNKIGLQLIVCYPQHFYIVLQSHFKFKGGFKHWKAPQYQTFLCASLLTDGVVRRKATHTFTADRKSLQENEKKILL